MAAPKRKRERQRAVPLLPEIRRGPVPTVEIRHLDHTDEIILRGEVVKYGVAYDVVDHVGRFRETIHAGAAKKVLARGVDCRLLLNHDGLPLARTTSGTLKLIDTPTALRYEARLDARQQLANDVAIAVERRDVTGSSIGMLVGKDKWGTDGDVEVRDIYELREILDCSVVAYPASPTTSVEIAQRMALAIPVESRARLRQLVGRVRAGERLSSEEFRVLDLLLGEEAPTSRKSASFKSDEPSKIRTLVMRSKIERAQQQRQAGIREQIAARTRGRR